MGSGRGKMNGLMGGSKSNMLTGRGMVRKQIVERGIKGMIMRG